MPLTSWPSTREWSTVPARRHRWTRRSRRPGGRARRRCCGTHCRWLPASALPRTRRRSTGRSRSWSRGPRRRCRSANRRRRRCACGRRDRRRCRRSRRRCARRRSRNRMCPRGRSNRRRRFRCRGRCRSSYGRRCHWLRWRSRRRYGRRRCGSRTHPRRFCRRIFRFLVRLGLGFSRRFRVRYSLEMFAHFLRNIRGNGARVRLLFRDAIPGQQVNNSLRLDLQLARQLVNSDLVDV